MNATFLLVYNIELIGTLLIVVSVLCTVHKRSTKDMTSNNQWLWSAGKIDRRSNVPSAPTLCFGQVSRGGENV